MKSFDIWDTLIARRSISDIHNEENNLFPIMENVLQVQPDDIMVSDFYDGELLKRVVPEITGLNNTMIITHDGKFTGSIWPLLKAQYNIAEHIGDNSHSDFTTPTNNGIKSRLSILSPFTDIEQEIDNIGLKGLARVMRETRLTTWDNIFRQLQVIQAQINFPMLFVASILLHRTNPKKLLMVSRDCCLWQYIQKIVRDKLGGTYDIEYFKTSRVAVALSNDNYLDYVNGLLPATIVDYSTGPNKSLLKLVKKTKYPNTQIKTIINKENNDNLSGFLNIEPRSVHPEFMNLARHAMYIDEHNMINPANIDWENMKEIKIAHETFLKACDIMQYYDFSSDFSVQDSILKSILEKLINKTADYASAFGFVNSFSGTEHNAIMEYLGK